MRATLLLATILAAAWPVAAAVTATPPTSPHSPAAPAAPVVAAAPAAAAAREAAAATEAAPATIPLPYVYTKWRQFTVKDGLPNDHVFAIKADGPRVWIGTEDGLALLDKATGKVKKVWREADGLPFRVITAIEVDPKTGDVWLGLFGGGLARLSGGRFDHWHQLNSGLVNDVVYGVAVDGDSVWVATTAGANRFNTRTGEWTVFNEKNAPMEEIWNYNVSVNDGKVHLAVWGSGVLEYDLKTGRWKEYLDPDGEMEIDLFRDDGINHVIVTSAQYIEGVLWTSSYFGASRYDGRHWRGYAKQEGGLPSDFLNNLRARSGQEAWFCSDKGLGVIADGPGDTWIVYTRDPGADTGRATITRGGKVVEVTDTGLNVPHNFQINMDIDGNDVWVATAKGVAWGIGEGYYAGLKARPLQTYGPAPAGTVAAGTVAAGAIPDGSVAAGTNPGGAAGAVPAGAAGAVPAGAADAVPASAPSPCPCPDEEPAFGTDAGDAEDMDAAPVER